MAADTAVWSGDFLCGQTFKIARLKDGRLFAGAGERSLTLQCMRWLNGEAERPAPVEEQDFGGLILAADGCYRVDYRFYVFPSATADFAVEGSSAELVFGALAAGASAEEAVCIGIKYGCHTGGEVQVERL